MGTTTGLGKYLYCIIRCSEERTFEDVAPIGDANGPVHTVACDGLAAVVSDTVEEEYDSTRANMLAHERVQERVMTEFTLLPVRFGTVASATSSAADVQKLLRKMSPEFHELLADMEGKVELGLKALWRDEKAIFEEIVAENQGIKKLRNSHRRQSPEVVRFEGIRLGEMVRKALDHKKSREALGLLAPLRRVARRSQENEVVLDRMLFNAAFLVDQSREGEFDQAAARLDEEWGHRINFKYTGPNPPWNFVEITVNWDDIL
ncbi:MAG: GvpL/GvpF family gas vesicle protein [Chloroflexi bacterium]|nr:GvpL/GvpF family gas vesicle protein [Chloroflexota bacterium]